MNKRFLMVDTSCIEMRINLLLEDWTEPIINDILYLLKCKNSDFQLLVDVESEDGYFDSSHEDYWSIKTLMNGMDYCISLGDYEEPVKSRLLESIQNICSYYNINDFTIEDVGYNYKIVTQM